MHSLPGRKCAVALCAALCLASSGAWAQIPQAAVRIGSTTDMSGLLSDIDGSDLHNQARTLAVSL